MHAQDSTLIARGLSVGWQGVACARQIDLELKPGTILAVAGPNGAGKSTLLNTLARQIPALSGSVYLNGKEIWKLPPRLYAQHVAYVPGDLALNQSLTVEELVLLGRNPHQSWWSWQVSAADKAKAEEALNKTGTWTLRHKYLSTLSAGERQRASVAMALAQATEFILLDEPAAHLDFRHQLELANLLFELRNQKIGIAIVLHDLNLVARLADQVIMLARQAHEQVSRVAICGDASKVLTQQAVEQIFGVQVEIYSQAGSNRRYFALVDTTG